MKVIVMKRTVVRLSNSNKKHYESLGYNCKQFKKSLEIDPNHLPPNSTIKLLVKCPRCKQLRMQRNDNMNKRNSTLCNPCSQWFRNKV